MTNENQPVEIETSYIPKFVSGKLPIGRFPVSLRDFELHFVDNFLFKESKTRRDRFNALQAILRIFENELKCKVLSLLIGGSFVTDKLDPNDIDVVFVIDFRSINTGKDLHALSIFFENNRQNVPVQCFHLFWLPTTPADPYQLETIIIYQQGRGQWDDFWLRDVPKELRQVPPHAEQSFHKKGYVEVKINEFA